ncbi:MAG: hypothetical protein ACLP2F_03250 [Steroidobacteraceae bacterium]
MGPTARKLKVYAQSLSIAFVLVTALAPTAHAQVSPVGAGSSIGVSNNPAAAPAARAPVLTYGVDAGVGESDNVTLAPTDKISQTIATADADFTVKEQSRLLDVNAKGDFTYLDYLQNAFSSQLLGRFDGVGNLAIVPGRLTWAMRDDFGQAALDPYTPVTPNNIEDVNYFSTGPDLSMRLGGVNFINLSARYARAQYETSPYNSNRGLGTLAVGRDVSAGALVSLNADFERVMFENTAVNTDFDRTSGFGRYELHGARTDFEGDLGATRISQEGPSTNGSLAKVQLSRKLSAAAKLTLTAGRELTDASSSFSTLQTGAIGAGGMIGTAPAALTSNNYTSNYASVGWQYVRNRTTIALVARWEKDTYSGQPQLDVNRPGADFNIQRQLTRAFSTQLLGHFYKTDFPNAAIASNTASSKYNDWLVGGALTWRHGRGLEIRLRYDHNSHVVSAGGSGYSENRVFLTVGYRPSSVPELTEPQ